MMSRSDEKNRNQPEDQLADLEQRLAAKREEKQARDRKYERPQGWAIGFRYGTEFLVGVLVGAAIGLVIDRFAGTTPFGIIIGTLLGFGSGTLNVVRAAKELSQRAERDNQGAGRG